MAAGTTGHSTLTMREIHDDERKVMRIKCSGWMPDRPDSPAARTLSVRLIFSAGVSSRDSGTSPAWSGRLRRPWPWFGGFSGCGVVEVVGEDAEGDGCGCAPSDDWRGSGVEAITVGATLGCDGQPYSVNYVNRELAK